MSKLANPFFCIIQIPLYKQNVMISVNQTDDQLLSSIVRTSSVWPKGVKRTKDKITHLLEAFDDVSSTNDGRTVLYDSGTFIDIEFPGGKVNPTFITQICLRLF